jgi:hypothetical protein
MANETDKLGMEKEFADPPEPPPVEKKTEEAAPPQKFMREIDLGDGSGKQKFEATSYEELCDKLANAQEHATRKIRELSRERKRAEPEKRSSDFQELRSTPLQGPDMERGSDFRRIFQNETGLTPEEFRNVENLRRRRDAEMDAQNYFVQRHQGEYIPTPENAQKIMRYLERENLPVSKRNLDYAFEELRGELTSVGTKQSTPSEPPKTAPPAEPPARQVSPPPSFLRPSLGGTPQIDSSGGIDAAEVARISQLPPAEMRARIEQLFRQSRAR